MVKWSGSGQSTEECNMQWKKLKGKEASPQTEKKSWTDVKWLDMLVTLIPEQKMDKEITCLKWVVDKSGYKLAITLPKDFQFGFVVD